MGPVTRALILINVAVYALQAVYGERMIATLALWPWGHFPMPGLHTVVGFQPWQLLTSAFLHASLAHVGLNMFALYMFGRDVEAVLGAARYLGLFTSAVLSAGLVQLAVVSLAATREPFPTVGASGGVFGVLLAFGMLFPRRRVTLLFPPIPMPAWLFVTLYGLLELTHGVLGTEAGVAHFAHLGGMLGAFALLRHWRGRETTYLPP